MSSPIPTKPPPAPPPRAKQTRSPAGTGQTQSAIPERTIREHPQPAVRKTRGDDTKTALHESPTSMSISGRKIKPDEEYASRDAKISTTGREINVEGGKTGRIDVSHFGVAARTLLISLRKITDKGKRKPLPLQAEGIPPEAESKPPEAKDLFSLREVRALEANLHQYSQSTYSVDKEAKAGSASGTSFALPSTVTKDQFTREYMQISTKAATVLDSLGKMLQAEPGNETLSSLKSNIEEFFARSLTSAKSKSALSEIANYIDSYSYELRVPRHSGAHDPALRLSIIANTLLNAGQEALKSEIGTPAGKDLKQGAPKLHAETLVGEDGKSYVKYAKHVERVSDVKQEALEQMLVECVKLEQLPTPLPLSKGEQQTFVDSLTKLSGSMQLWLGTYLPISKTTTPNVHAFAKKTLESLESMKQVLDSEKLVKSRLSGIRSKSKQGILSKTHQSKVGEAKEKIATFLWEHRDELSKIPGQSSLQEPEPPRKPVPVERLGHSSSQALEKTTGPVQKSEVHAYVQAPKVPPRRGVTTPQAAPRRDRGGLSEDPLQRDQMLDGQGVWQGQNPELAQGHHSAGVAPELAQASKLSDS